MLTGQCVGLKERLVFVCTVNGGGITLPHRAGALQYRCRSHDVLGIIKHSEVSTVFGLDGPSLSLPPPIPEAQTTICSSTRYTSTTIYVQAAVRVRLKKCWPKERERSLISGVEGCCVFSASSKGWILTTLFVLAFRLSPFTTPTPSHIKG
jgi:hypothetical protein